MALKCQGEGCGKSGIDLHRNIVLDEDRILALQGLHLHAPEEMVADTAVHVEGCTKGPESVWRSGVNDQAIFIPVIFSPQGKGPVVGGRIAQNEGRTVPAV